MCGNVIFLKIVVPFAPISAAASSSSVPSDSSTGISSLEMNGNVTNTVARIIPGTAKITLIPSSLKSGYIGLCLPNVSTNIRPAIMGETVTGRSMSVVRSFLPLNLNFVIDQAAKIPNTVLNSTANTVASTVSTIAFTV